MRATGQQARSGQSGAKTFIYPQTSGGHDDDSDDHPFRLPFACHPAGASRTGGAPRTGAGGVTCERQSEWVIIAVVIMASTGLGVNERLGPALSRAGLLTCRAHAILTVDGRKRTRSLARDRHQPLA